MTQIETSLWFTNALLPEGWRDNVRVVFRGSQIAEIEPGTPPQAGDERHGIALPGLCNVHSHAFQRAMAGLAEVPGATGRDNFWSWRDTMYRLAADLTPADLRAIAAMAYVEMLECGFVRVGEFHYLHHDTDGRPYPAMAEMSAAIAGAAELSGIALTLLPVFYGHADFGGVASLEQQRRFVTTIDQFERLLRETRHAIGPLADATLGVAPHSLRAVTAEELRLLEQLLPAAPVHIHIAEQVGEVAASLAWSGARPVEWLLDNVHVDDRWCLVHATHVDATELQAIADCKAVVGLCPMTEANLGDGIFAARDFVDRKGRIGIGSDSNVRIDLAEELRMLEYSQRLSLRQRNVMAGGERSTGRALYDLAHVGGGQALGQPHAGLHVGAAADLVTLSPATTGTPDQALDQWIFGSQRNAVRDVWRRGRRVVVDGRHILRESVAGQFALTMRRLAG